MSNPNTPEGVARLGNLTPNTQPPTPAANIANPFAGLTVQASGAEPLPPGAYFAVFLSLEPFTNDKVADKLRFTFQVASGQQQGRNATALTDQRITPNTHAGRLIAGLVGRALTPGEDMSAVWQTLQSRIGKRYMVTVQAGPKGGKPSVQSVALPPEM